MEDHLRQHLSLWRHFDAAMNAAATIAAISRCTMTDREPLYPLVSRQELQLIDQLHGFAYNARRAIELADDYEKGILNHAKGINLPGFAETHATLRFDEEPEPLADRSLWWFLGRIVHSRELKIRPATRPQVGSIWAGAPNITVYQNAIALAVRSDYDEPDETHLAKIDELLQGFLALRTRLERAIGLAVGEAAPPGG